MWGQIITDLTYNTNYQFTFPQSNSDMLLNLTHWQYWWWFWFTYLLTLYFFIFIRLIRNRLMKFHPKMSTSYRSHGKWGDFIVCILPISWCANILTNSNFILRMIEWQTESNLFTVRIRGKQWYWVYKLELRSMINSISAPKNLGHNYWLVFNNTNLQHTNFYISLLEMSHYSSWIETYLTTYYKTHFNAINTNSNKNKFYKNWENLYLNQNLNKVFFKPKLTKSNNSAVFINIDLINKYLTPFTVFKKTATPVQLVTKLLKFDKLSTTPTTSLTSSNLKFFSSRIHKLFAPVRIRSVVDIYKEIDNEQVLVETFLTFKEDPFFSTVLKFSISNLFNVERATDLGVINHEFNRLRPTLKLTAKTFNVIKSSSTFVTDVSRQLRTNMFAKRNFFKLNFLNNKLYINILPSSNSSKLKPTPDNSYLIIKQKRYVPVQILNVYNDNGKRHDASFMLWNTHKFVIKDHSYLQLGKPKKLVIEGRKALTHSLFKSYSISTHSVKFSKATSLYQNLFSNIQVFIKPTQTYLILNTSYFKLNKFNLFNFNLKLVPVLRSIPTYYLTKFFHKEYFKLILTNPQLFNLSNPTTLHTPSFFEKYTYWKQNLRLAYRTKKSKTPNFSTINNRRLLRTGRVLVLPTNINITLITNSFDVVHSWYIPGLGVKMDCIPGRSTHHTLNIDHAGFYYGQCAEICGRFHHHMPIRVCALPFEHFLIWWYHYGLPYFNNIDNDRASFIKPGIRQYRW